MSNTPLKKAEAATATVTMLRNPMSVMMKQLMRTMMNTQRRKHVKMQDTCGWKSAEEFAMTQQPMKTMTNIQPRKIARMQVMSGWKRNMK